MPYKTFRSFGGIYDGNPDLVNPDDAASLAVNCRFISQGLRRQYGFDRLVPTKAQDSAAKDQLITAIWDYMDGEDQHLLAVAGDSLLEYNNTVPALPVWDTIQDGLAVQTAAGGSTDAGLRTSFVTSFGRCYFQNGYMDPLVYDGPSGEVYKWGLPGPIGPALKPVAVPQNQVGVTGSTFGEFDVSGGDFEVQQGYWTDSEHGAHNEGPIGQQPKDWVNINDTRCDVGTDAYATGQSLKVETGAALNNGWGLAASGFGKPNVRHTKIYAGTVEAEYKHGGTGSGSYQDWKWMRGQYGGHWLTKFWNSTYDDTGSIATVNGSKDIIGTNTLFTSEMEGMLIVTQGTPWVYNTIVTVVDETHATLEYNELATESGIPYRINNSFYRWNAFVEPVTGYVNGVTFHSRTPAGGWPVTGSDDSWDFYRGPNDGLLSRQIPVAVGGKTFTVSCWVKAWHEEVELEVRGVGTTTRSRKVVAMTPGAGDNNWTRIVNTHTFGAGEVGTVYLRNKVDRLSVAPVPTLEQQLQNQNHVDIERTAYFDEVRIVEGATAPSEGGELNGFYQYRYSFYDVGDSTESNWSDPSTVVEVKGGISQVTIPIGPNGLYDPLVTGKWYDPTAQEHAVTHLRVCRSESVDGGITFGPYYSVLEKSLVDIELEQIAEPNDFPYTFDDTVAPAVAITNDLCEGEIIDPPRGKFCVMYEGQMIVAGLYDPLLAPPIGESVPSDGRKLYYSDVNRPGVFRSDGFLEIDTNDNDQITGLAVNQGRLWVFTKDSIFEVSALGDDFERVTKRHDGIGCVSGFGISAFEGVLFFPDRNGIYAMDNSGRLERITKEIELAWKRAVDFDALQLAVLTDKKLWFNSLDFLWCYDIEQKDSQGKGKWSTLSSGQSFWTIGYRDTGAENKMLMADEYGYLYEMDAVHTRQGWNANTLGGVATAGGPSTVDIATASFYDVGDGLEGLIVHLHHLDAKGNQTDVEGRIIDAGNTATQLSVTVPWTVQPNTVNGDFISIGTISMIYRTKFHDFGEPAVKKLVKRMKVGVESSFTGIPATTGDNVALSWRSRDQAEEVGAWAYYGLSTDGTQETKWINVRQRGYQILFGFGGWAPDVDDVITYVLVEFEGKDNNV